MKFPRFLQPSGEYKEVKSPLEVDDSVLNKSLLFFDTLRNIFDTLNFVLTYFNRNNRV